MTATIQCSSCRYSEKAESISSLPKWNNQKIRWPQANPDICPKCGGKSVSVTTGYKLQQSINPYAGENLGLDTYIRSESHWKEEVKKQGVIPVG